MIGEPNLALLAVIREHKPRSIGELAELSGRRESNLLRTLKTLERHPIVSLERTGLAIRPKVNATQFRVEFGLRRPVPQCQPERRAAG